MQKLSTEQQNEVKQLYVEGIPVADIAVAYNIDKSTVCRITKRLGAPPRLVKSSNLQDNSNRTKYKTCQACKKVVKLDNVSYCPYCGKDIRTPREMLISRVSEAMKVSKYLPESMRDTMQQLLADIANELTKGV